MKIGDLCLFIQLVDLNLEILKVENVDLFELYCLFVVICVLKSCYVFQFDFELVFMVYCIIFWEVKILDVYVFEDDGGKIILVKFLFIECYIF